MSEIIRDPNQLNHKRQMMSEDKIISYCQVITHWAAMRGQAMVWQEQKFFDKYDGYVKRWVRELKEYIKNELPEQTI
jgi:hypothetical protein